MELRLKGTYQNIEQAIIDAIHILAPYSEFGDESVRCKDIFRLVKESTIIIDGQQQTGNHRFTLFSSALSGRRTSLKLFQKITDPERHGAWWKLKVPYEEALRIAHSIRLRNPSKGGECDVGFTLDNSFIPKSEEIRNRFMSFVPLSLMGSEIRNANANIETTVNELKVKLEEKKANATQEELQNLDHLVGILKRIDDVRRDKQRMVFNPTADGHQMPFFQ